MLRELSAADVRAYLDRDWEAAREQKRAYWRDRSKRASLADLLALSEDLLVGPTEQSREADLEAHIRLAALFAKTAVASFARKRAARASRNRPPRVR